MSKLVRVFSPIGLACALIAAGCKPKTEPPAPLALEQIGPEMRRAFANSQPETKALVEAMLAALQSTNYPDAYQSGEAVNRATGITREQLLITSRALLTVNALLQQARAQGDQGASTFIDYQKHNR